MLEGGWWCFSRDIFIVVFLIEFTSPYSLNKLRGWHTSKHLSVLVQIRSMILHDARCTREIKSRIAMAKNRVQQEEYSFHPQIALKEETGKVLHLERSFWC